MGLGDIVKVIVTGDSEGARRALKSASKEAGNTGSSLKSMAKVGGLAFVALGAAAIDFGKHAVKAAEDEQTAHTKLLVALKNNHEQYSKNKDAIEAVDKASEKYGYTIADTESALAQGETATGSMKKTLDELTIAQNLAAMTGQDLSTAMTAVEKAGEGNLKPLKAMGVDLPIISSSAEKTKVAYEAWGKALQHVKDVQDATNTKTTTTGLANDAAVLRAKQNLTDAEQRYSTAKQHTVGQLQAITHAQEAVRTAEAKTATGSQNNSGAVAKALLVAQAAQAKFNDLSGAGVSAMEALRKKVAGGASEAAKTFRGHTQALKAEWVDFEAKIGNDIIPVIDDLMKDIASPQAHHDALQFVYDMEKGFAGIGNAAVDVINLFLDIERMASAPHNFLAKFGFGKQVNIPANYKHFGAPTDPNAVPVQGTPALAAFQGRVNAPNDNKSSGLYSPGFGAPAPVHIHVHAQPTPAMIKTWTDAYNKRNGTKAPNAKHTSTSP